MDQLREVGEISPLDLGIVGVPAWYAAVYFPLVTAEDPLMDNNVRPFPACSIIAGIYAMIDMNRGVWKAPAGMDFAESYSE